MSAQTSTRPMTIGANAEAPVDARPPCRVVVAVVTEVAVQVSSEAAIYVVDRSPTRCRCRAKA